MKRWILGIAIVIVAAIALCLFMPVSQHSEFEGEWYSAGEGELYLVQSDDGEVLNDAADGSGNTYFYRNQEAAVHAAD